MTFLLPLGLLALLTLPLIALLHLIRERRRRVAVPSLELWRLTPAPVQRRPRRLPLTLLLLLHLLIAALLALSLGRPVLQGGTLEPRSTVVVLDTSTSMGARDAGGSGGGTRFAAAQAEARRIFEGARQGDTVALVTLGTTPRLIGSGGAEAVTTLIDELGALKPAGSDGDLQSALSLATAAGSDNGSPARRQTVVLTDPAFGSRANAAGPITATGELDWRTYGESVDNVAVVAFAARPLRAGGQQIYARVANLGSRPAARTIQVALDGATVAEEPVRLEAGAEAEWSWPIPAGASVAEARLNGGDVAPIDDRASAVLAGGTSVRVELVSDAPTTLERALRAQPGLDVSLQAPQQYRHDPEAGLAVFVNFIPPELPPVPTLLVAPPRNNTLLPVTELAQDLRADSTPDARFAAIDVRGLRFARAALIETPAWANVAVAAGETPLVLTGVFEGQPRAIWTFDPAASNLQGRLAFPLLTAASLRTLLPPSGSALELGTAAPAALVAPGGAAVPAGTLLAEPGVYRWVDREGAVAVNTLAATEADLQPRPRPTVVLTPEAAGTRVAASARELWRPILAGVLLLLLLEWLYANRHAFAWATGRGRNTA